MYERFGFKSDPQYVVLGRFSVDAPPGRDSTTRLRPVLGSGVTGTFWVVGVRRRTYPASEKGSDTQ